ncbi:hypothetical protein MASR2M8_03640 [Opitutaceae bacterium]
MRVWPRDFGWPGLWLVGALLAGAASTAGGADAAGSGAGRWHIPPPTFAYEVMSVGDRYWVGSNDGLWRLDASGARRVGRRGEVATPVAVGADRMWVIRDGRIWESPTHVFRPSPLKTFSRTGVTVVRSRHGHVFADTVEGTWWSREGSTWHGPLTAAGQAQQIDYDAGLWWALRERDDEGRYELARSSDLQTWTPAAGFAGDQPGMLAAGAGVILVADRGGVHRFAVAAPLRGSRIPVGPEDERPAVYFEHGYFWLQGERDGLWRSPDGRDWQDLAPVLVGLAAPLSHLGFASDALLLTGYTGEIRRVPLSVLGAVFPLVGSSTKTHLP